MKDIIIETIISIGMMKNITLRYYWGMSSSVSMLRISDNLLPSTTRPDFGTLWKLEELQD
ncbi:hypothetical protein [Spiroplasma endosymbiont of Nebria brevicollis]|uniref:hypothetical protein n=1 Tax=Spiroplasma endosymbiont of Nebria brevicollis TaxID=3066284 RepID=UPI00313E192E